MNLMWIDYALAHSPLQLIARRQHKNQLTVLAYHGVDNAERFAQQIAFIATKMHPLSIDELILAIRKNQPLPEHAVLTTFDDGERSVFEVGLPILQRYGVPALVFVITSLIDTDTPFWWQEVAWLANQGITPGTIHSLSPDQIVRDLKRLPTSDRTRILSELRAQSPHKFSQPQLCTEELQALVAGGITIGNHTHTHPALDQATDTELEHEIVTAHHFLTERLKQAPQSFAFPYGYENRKAHTLLSNLGYSLGFLFDHCIAQWPIKQAYQISRLRVNATDSLDRFMIVLSGLHPTIHHAIGRK